MATYEKPAGRFSPEQIADMVRQMEAKLPIIGIAEKYGCSRETIRYHWRRHQNPRANKPSGRPRKPVAESQTRGKPPAFIPVPLSQQPALKTPSGPLCRVCMRNPATMIPGQGYGPCAICQGLT